MTSDSEELMMSGGCLDSPPLEDTNSGGGSIGASTHLKKGPWTSAEDAILVDYVNKHGEGNWNAVQKHSGLFRCGKSCRLRWANHLRPDLKKGSFTAEEERRIIELHAKMGNKWARMAAELPGRTDNEIKNFWNTRIKRRQRAGLPIYPPDICIQAYNENQQSQSMVTFATGDTSHAEILATNNLEIPAVEFKDLELNQELYPPVALDMAANNLLDQGNGFLGRGNSFLFPLTHPPHKRVRRSDSLFPGCNFGLNDVLPTFDHYQDDGSEKIAESYDFSSSYRNNLNVANPSSSSSLFHGSHAYLNGNFSSSEPILPWAMKLELPSLQYSDNQVVGSSWGTPSSPLPSLESVDTLIQTPPPIEERKSDCLSPRNSGLLEAVLYESQALKKVQKSNSCPKLISNGHSVIPGEVADSSSQNIHEPEWEAYADPISPLGHSATSVFSDYTPFSGSSLDEQHSTKTIPVKQEAKEEVMDYSRPDFLLGSNWFGSFTERGKDHSMLSDAFGPFLGDGDDDDYR